MDDNSEFVLTLGFLLFAALGGWGLFKIRRVWLEEQRILAAQAMIKAAKGFYLCGVPLEVWTRDSIATKLLHTGVADFMRVFGEEMTYALCQDGLFATVFYSDRHSKTEHYKIAIRFVWEGDTWQYTPEDVSNWTDEIVRVPPGRHFFRDVEGMKRVPYNAPWMKAWRERWEPCRTEAGSMKIPPDSLCVEGKMLTEDFQWPEHAEDMKKLITDLAWQYAEVELTEPTERAECAPSEPADTPPLEPTVLKNNDNVAV